MNPLLAALVLVTVGQDPAVSRDGRWLAYVADTGGLWIRAYSGGDPRQVAAQGSAPAFSPDGGSLAFRGKDGVYVSAVAGGRSRLVASGGERPRYSPDGKQIAYHSASGLYLVAASGGQARQVHPGGKHAVWSPDGSRLLFQACRGESCDWLVSPTDGSKTTVAAQGRNATPELWMASDQILFTEKNRLWTAGLAGGPPRRLTTADHDERSPVLAPDGTILYTSIEENIDVYMMRLDADRGIAKGAPARITNDPSIDQRPSLSRDGRRIAWETSRGGNFEVWVKDLVSGAERAITSGPLREHMPAVSRDGARLLYDAHDGETVTVFAADFQGGQAVKIITEDVGQGSFQWTASGREALYFHRAPPGTVGLLNLETKQRTPLLRHPKFNLSLADARLSPDGRWIAFPVPYAAHRSRLAVAPVTAGKVIEDERDWTYVTPEVWNASQPEWSPSGRWLYFLSDETGRLAVHALKLSASKTPVSGAKLILDLGDTSTSISEMRPRDIGLAIAKDKLALGAATRTGKLFSIRPSAPQATR
ncbi:MAG: PD40 domain-containing protein [Bryobacterales bacterium]|nr:PD40 domain-containing protein [Bryobacterales bacterium]